MDYDEEDDVFGAGVLELERRGDLERIRARGARVEADLIDDTALKSYVDYCRSDCVDALYRLAAVDPNDAIAVLHEQHRVRAYLRVRDWARGKIEASIKADEQLKGETSDSDE